MLHSLFLRVGLELPIDLGVFVYGEIPEYMALVIVQINGQAVFLRLLPQSSAENVMLRQEVTAGVLLAKKAIGMVLL